MLVPELVATRPLAPIAASGEPIRPVSLTISSQAGPVYLDVWAPTTAPPPIPGARAPGYSHYPGRGRQSHDATARQYHRITGALWVGGDDNDKVNSGPLSTWRIRGSPHWSARRSSTASTASTA